MKTITIPNAQLIPAIKQLISEGYTATFRVRGFSMRPFLEDGRDKAVIAPVAPAAIKRGDVILAEVSPQVYVLHRVASVTDNGIVCLRGDGNVKGTETCRLTDVIGIATGFVRGRREKFCSTMSRRWKTYCYLWPSSPILRRWLLAFHRHIFLKIMG